jgi:Leucine-rich repeat (LRR) protein
MCSRCFFFMNSAWKEHFDAGIPPPLSHCSWPGVTCESGEAFVTEIELEDARLVGTLPSEIGLLLGLKKLVLHRNALSGKIPDKLPPGLNTLDLGRNRMTGTMPEMLFALPLLEVVNLSNNLFGGTLTIDVGYLQYMGE